MIQTTPKTLREDHVDRELHWEGSCAILTSLLCDVCDYNFRSVSTQLSSSASRTLYRIESKLTLSEMSQKRVRKDDNNDHSDAMESEEEGSKNEYELMRDAIMASNKARMQPAVEAANAL